MISWLMHRMTNVVVDAIVNRVLQDPYTENLFSFLTIAQKLTPRAIVETGMRAESGKPLERPLGSPVVLSPWEKLLFNPVHLYRLPTPDGVQIATEVTIGPRARRPLTLEIPVLISGMSYGGALGLKAKIALARGASLAGTATNSGEAPLIEEERKEAKFFIGQYNRGGWMNTDEQLKRLDAIEIQLGQGAQAAAPMGTRSWQIDETFRKRFNLAEGEDARIHTRLPGMNRVEDFPPLVRELRERYGVAGGAGKPAPPTIWSARLMWRWRGESTISSWTVRKREPTAGRRSFRMMWVCPPCTPWPEPSAIWSGGA